MVRHPETSNFLPVKLKGPETINQSPLRAGIVAVVIIEAHSQRCGTKAGRGQGRNVSTFHLPNACLLLAPPTDQTNRSHSARKPGR